jgi:hypothetical protein
MRDAMAVVSVWYRGNAGVWGNVGMIVNREERQNLEKNPLHCH